MTDLSLYRMTNRGTKGVKTIKISEKNGTLVSLKVVNGNEDCMIMTNDGIIIRFNFRNAATSSRDSIGLN